MREGYKLVYRNANVVMIIERFVGQKNFLNATVYIFEDYFGLTRTLIKVRGLSVSGACSNAQRNVLEYLATQGVEFELIGNVACYEFTLTSGSGYCCACGEGKPLIEFYPSEEKSGQRKNWLAKLFMKK